MHQSKNATISFSFANIKLYILLALSSIFLASCVGSSSGGSSGSTITVGLFKGPTVGASCDITDASGKTINRITGPKGLSIESSSISPGILTVSCSGGTYIDEATNAEVDAPNMRAVAYYPGGDFKIIISPLSEIAYQRAIAVAGNVDSLDESKVNAESEAVATLFGLDGVNTLQTIPTPIVGTNAATAEDNDEGRFAMVLAGLSKMIGDSQGGTSTAQVEAGIDALVKDLAEDGVFDTKDSLIAGINSVVVSNPSIDSEVNATLTTAISDATLDATATLTAVEAPAISVPNNTQYVYVVNTAITNLVYSALESSGGATECSISSLPQGLQLNGTTTLTVAPNRSGQCVISGTPSTVTATANYTLTVSNAIGSESAEISLTVNPEAPNVADASAQTLTKGTPATISFDNTGGTITSCTLDVTSDSLTGTGLSLNSNDCSITGTPNTVTTLNIVVVATNVTATDTANVSITINDEAPALQNIPTKQIFALNVAKTITFNNAGGGTLTECSVSPALPTGLTIAPNSTNTTCEITGSATTETPVATYTITAKNATAQSNADVAIEVVNIIPVNVVPITSSVFENAGSVVAFRIETTPAPSSDLTGTLNFGGNASTGGHASAAKSTFTIAAGTTSTTLSINLTDNEYPNSARVFTAQVSSVSDTTYGPGATGRIDITDNDAPYVVTVSGTNAPLTEADNAILTFTISTNRAVATNDAVTVDLSYGDSSTTADVSGTSDFSNIPTQVVISAGENSATLELPLVNDNTVERTEYVNAAISNATNAHGGSFAIGNSQTATINDNDVYTLTITAVTNGSEPNTNGAFSVSVSPANATGSPITGTINYTGSTAVDNTDYQNAPVSFSIADGATSQTITITALDDGIVDADKVLTATISDINASGFATATQNTSANITLSDDDGYVFSITALNNPTEPSSDSTVDLFLVAVNSENISGSDLVGNITYGGTAESNDYINAPAQFTIAPNQSVFTVTVTIKADTVPETNETISAQLTGTAPGGGSYDPTTNVATATLEADSDSYQLSIANNTNATEDGTAAEFVVSVSPQNTSGGNIVGSITFGGSAVQDDFNTAFPTEFTIANNTSAQTITLTVNNDDRIENLETLNATITNQVVTSNPSIPSNIVTDNASLTLTDNDVYTLTITAVTNGSEPNTNGAFSVSVSPANATGSPITGTINYTGSAIEGTDYQDAPVSFSIADGAASQTITITALNDDIADADKVLTATISDINASGFATTTQNTSANITLSDDDGYVVSIVKVQDAIEGSQNAVFRIDLSSPNISGSAITGTLTYGGSATSGDDYTAGPATYSIGANANSQTITLAIDNDDTPEANEDISITLGNPSDGSVNPAASVATATLEADSDSYQLSIANNTNATEDGTAAEFVVSVSPQNTSGGNIVGSITFGGSAVQDDFNTAFPTEFTIANNTSAQTITLTVNNDDRIENLETLNATITNQVVTSNPSIPSNIVTDNASLTLTDNDVYTFNITAVTNGGEPNTNGAFSVSVSPANATGNPITGTINYTGSAIDGTDYQDAPTSFTIADGTASQTITITALNDDIADADKVLTATISDINASGFATTTQNTSANITLSDDDGYVVSIVKVQDAIEGSQNAVFRIDLSSPNISGSAITGTLTYGGSATSGDDYTAGPATYSIGANANSQTITLAIDNDDTPEANEDISITLGNPSDGSVNPAASVATATLEADSDSYQLSIANNTNATEDGTAAEFVVSVSPQNTSGGNIVGSITFGGSAVQDDFNTAFPTEFTIANNTSAQTITLTVNNDDRIENLETLNATITNQVVTSNPSIPSNIVTDNASLTLTDNDVYTFNITAVTNGGEPNTNGAFSVSVSPANATGSPITGTINYTGSTAVDNTDYQNAPVSFSIADGATSQTITITALDDGIVDADKVLTATISDINASGFATATQNTSANITLSDDDGYVVSIVKVQDAIEGSQNAVFRIDLSSPNISGSAITGTLNYGGSATSGDDYTAGPTTYSIGANANSQTITLAIDNDDTPEANEDISITLGSPSDGSVNPAASSASATLEADNDAYTISIESVANQDVTEGDGNSPTFRVVANHPVLAGDSINVAISYTGSASGSDDISTPTIVTIPAGATSATYTVDVVDDNIAELSELFTITLNNSQANTTSNGIAVNRSSTSSAQAITYAINNDDRARVSFNTASSSANEGDSGTSLANVGLNMSNPSSVPITITYTVSGTANNPDDHTLSGGTITIPAGQTVGTITITDIRGDNVVEDDEIVIITLIRATGATDAGDILNHTYTITNDDTTTVNFAASSSSADEGNTTSSANVGLNISNPSSVPITITYTVDGTANNPDDHTLSDGTITIPAGQTAGTITITDIRGDNVVEDDETVIITITGLTSGADAGNILNHTYTITNDDTTTVNFDASSSSANEGNSGTSSADVTLSMTNPSSAATTITYTVGGTANNPDDHTLSDGTITIPAGQTVGTITITDIRGDNVVEDDETVIITITRLTGAELGSTLTHTYTITNDDTTTLQFASGLPTSGLESATALTLTVTLTNPAVNTITAGVAANASSSATGGGTDYTLPNSVTINAGDTVGTISITITDDNIVEGTETIVVDLSNVSGITGVSLGSPVQHTYSILPSNPPNISGNSGSAYTATANIAFTQSLTNTGTNATVCTIKPVLPNGMSISVVNGTCEISGTPTDDLAVVSHTVSAGNVVGTSTATISFEVVNAPNISVTRPIIKIVKDVNDGTISFLSNSGGPITSYAISNASSGGSLGDNTGLSFNTTTGEISGTALGSAVAPATYTITATGPNGATSQATIQIEVTQDLQAPQISALTYNATAEIEITEVVKLANTGGTIQTWSISGTGVTGPVDGLYNIGNNLTFNQRTGEVEGTPAGPAAETNYTVNAGNNSGFDTATLTLTVLSKPVSNVNVPSIITSYPVITGQTENNINVKVEIDTDGTTNDYEAEYRLTSDSSGNWSLNLGTDAVFDGALPPFGDYTNGHTLTFKVTVTNAQNAINIVTKESTVSTSSTYSISDSRVIEGVDGTKTMVFTIFREGDNSTEGSVEYAVDTTLSLAQAETSIAGVANTYENGSGTVDNDYVGATSGTVTFPAGGAQVQTIEFTINGDYWKEINQNIIVNIGTPTGGVISRNKGLGIINELDTNSMLVQYALRDLNPEKATYAIRVRRSSDNVEQDIGFDHNGFLDTTALLNFVGANSGHVSLWYNQNDDGRDLEQSVAIKQGTIVYNGTLLTMSNGDPAIVFNESENGTNPNDNPLNGAYTLPHSSTNRQTGSWMITKDIGDALTSKSLEVSMIYQYRATSSGFQFNLSNTNESTQRIAPTAPFTSGYTYWDAGSTDKSTGRMLIQNIQSPNTVQNLVFTANYNNTSSGNASMNYVDAKQAVYVDGERKISDNTLAGSSLTLGEQWMLMAAFKNDQQRTVSGRLNTFLVYSNEDGDLISPSTQFNSGSQNDAFTYAGDLQAINGATGYDTIYINRNATPTITLDTVANSATSTIGVNSIELILAEGNNQVDVITLTDDMVDSTDNDTIEIVMDSNDSITIPVGYSVTNGVTFNGVIYEQYTKGSLNIYIRGTANITE